MGHKITPSYLQKLTPCELVVYARDVRVCYVGPTPDTDIPSARAEIVEFTKRSRARLAFVASNTAVEFVTMITLTYPAAFPGDGEQVKKHLHAILAAFRRRWPGLDYLWFLEFQRRGAPHFHVLTNAPHASSDRAWLSRAWYNIVESGDENHLRAGTRIEAIREPDGARRYAVKYAAKMRQKAVPPAYRNVGRFWGHTRAVSPAAVAPNIPLGGIDDLLHYLQRWAYRDRLDHPMGTLYNAAADVVVQQLIDREARRG